MKLYDLSKVAMSVGAPYLERSEQMRCTKGHWDAIALAVAKAVLGEAARECDPQGRFIAETLQDGMRWSAARIRAMIKDLEAK